MAIRVTSKKAKRIKLLDKPARRIGPQEVAKALGAEYTCRTCIYCEPRKSRCRKLESLPVVGEFAEQGTAPDWCPLAREDRIAGLEKRLKNAAMAWWRSYEATDHYRNPWHVLQDEPLREAFRAACAALDAAEHTKERP